MPAYQVIFSYYGEVNKFGSFFDLDKALSFVLIPDPEIPWHKVWHRFKEVPCELPVLARWEFSECSVQVVICDA